MAEARVAGGGCCPPMDLFKSEAMPLVQLIITIESAHHTVSYIGDLGLLQFKDARIMQKIEETFGGKKEEQRKGEPQAGLGQQGHTTQGGYGQQGQQGYNAQGERRDTQGGYGQQGYTAQGERKEGFVDSIKDKLPGSGGGMHKSETQGGYGQQGHNTQGGYGQQGKQGYNAQGECKEGFVDNIKDKLPGGVGGVGMHKGEAQGGYGQQGHNTQGGYGQQGQQGYNTQGERKEGFVDNIKDKIPGGDGVGGMHKGETQGGYGQQGHNTQGGYGQQGYNTQGERKERFGGVGGGGMHKGETQGGYGKGHNTQGGYGQQGSQDLPKEGFVDKIKHCVGGGGERKK